MNRERLESLLDNEVAMMEAWEYDGTALCFTDWEWKEECGTFRCLAGHYIHRLVEQRNMMESEAEDFRLELQSFFNLASHFDISNGDSEYIFSPDDDISISDRRLRIEELLGEAP